MRDDVFLNLTLEPLLCLLRVAEAHTTSLLKASVVKINRTHFKLNP